MSKEIVTMVSGKCIGGDADPKRQLQTPVFITVDINREGERRVSCPFLKGISNPNNNIVWLCEARRSIDNTTVNEVMEKTADQAVNELPEGSDIDRWRVALHKIFAEFAQCPYKRPR